MLKMARSALEKVKRYAVELVVSVCYCFRQFPAFFTVNYKNILGGGADVFYFGGVFAIYQNRKRLDKLRPCFYIIGSILLYSILQIIFIGDIALFKMFVNICKISLNILLAYYVYENYKMIDMFKLTIFVTALNGFFTLVALFFRDNALWTQNDIVNKYNLSRLKLFYLEPSELGFHVIVIIILLLGFFLSSPSNKKRVIILGLLMANIVIMALSKPLGAIGFGGLAIAVLIVFDWATNKTRLKTIFLILFILLGAVTTLLLILTKNSIYLRVVDTLNGTDSSNWYRIKVAFSVMVQSFLDTRGLGIGLGNMRTQAVMDKYYSMGFSCSLANSFPSFITEGGIFAVLFIGGLFFILVRKCISSRSAVKWSLLVFLFTYQFFGGYFTSPLYWILYGLILGNFNESKKVEQVHI